MFSPIGSIRKVKKGRYSLNQGYIYTFFRALLEGMRGMDFKRIEPQHYSLALAAFAHSKPTFIRHYPPSSIPFIERERKICQVIMDGQQ
jgi:hypothetical protein